MEVHFFPGFHGVGAYVKTAKTDLDISDNGILLLSLKVIPTEFFLTLSVGENLPIFFTQKDVGKEGGEYHKFAKHSQLMGVRIARMETPIQVLRAGSQVWTAWHQQNPNRIDCWFLDQAGRLELFQIGVVTHDDGQTFRLVGEYRWQGRILRAINGEIVARPDDPVWGSLLWRQGESRQAIRQHPIFRQLLATAALELWHGSPEELDPPLDPVPAGKFGRVDWYVCFAGQKGQGIVKLADGSSAWIHGQDFAVPANADGIRRLHRGELVSYMIIDYNWGTKEGPPKLLGIHKIAEDKAPINPR